MDYDTIVLEAEEKMAKGVDHFAQELRGVRSGRATPGLVENLKVEYYGSPTPLGQMSQISIPEPRLIVIKPFDASQIQEVAKSIQTSDLGINPTVDGKIIRLNLPPLSEERRKKLVALVKEKSEAAKITVRNVRRDANKQADSSQKSGDVSEDDNRKLKDEIQALTKTYEDKVESTLKTKVDELMAV